MKSCNVSYLESISGKFSPNPSNWTAVIPAAGKGTRLGYHKPKILFPVAGKPIIDWLIALTDGLCGKLVFVVSPQGQDEIAKHLSQNGQSSTFNFAIQPEPLGMADAVAIGLSKVATKNALVIWGDQPGVHRKTLQLAMTVHETSHESVATIPTVVRESPYIHFELDDGNNLLSVLQAREGSSMPAVGESDCGTFLFDTAKLRTQLHLANQERSILGAQTKELNLLQLFPLLARADHQINLVRGVSEAESLGVNSQDDAAKLSLLINKHQGVQP